MCESFHTVSRRRPYIQARAIHVHEETPVCSATVQLNCHIGATSGYLDYILILHT